MSANDPHAHESAIKTPQQLVMVIVLAFVVPIIGISMLAQLVLSSATPGAPSSSLTAEAITQRIKPVASVAFGEGGAAGGSRGQRTGEQVVQAVCAACHQTGAAKAPKIGDAKAWRPLIKEGMKDLLATAIKGKGAMPPRGGNPELSDQEIERAIVYMANKSGGKFKEPAAPAASAAPAAAVAAPVAAAPAGAAPAAASAATGRADGKKVYDSACFACHAQAVAGSPKFGDKAAWAPRIRTGMAALYASVTKGKGAMPPKGGNPALSDAEIQAAVDFMVNAAR